MFRLVVAALIGALLGGSAVHFLAPPAAVETGVTVRVPAPDLDPPQPRDPVLAEPGRSVAGAPFEDRQSEATGPDVLISAALRRHAEEGLRAGWKAVRKDEIPDDDLSEGMKSFEKLVLESPLGIGRSLGERRTKAEEALADAQSGGVFALLEKLDAGGVGPLPGLVRDPKQFDPLFARMLSEERRSGLVNREHLGKDVEDGVTLTWPAGVFSIRNLGEKKPFPRDVTLEGAGMNATLLVLSNALMMGRLRNFAIRDCTVHTNGNYLFDSRRTPAAIRFDRVRFVGFDTGAGGSCLLGTSSLALWARNCRFEGGYGRSPQHGTLFDVRTDALVARFDACHLSLLSLDADDLHPGATVLFSGCVLEQLLDNPLDGADGRPGILFDNCSITRFEGGMGTVPRLDLDALFPAWRTRME